MINNLKKEKQKSKIGRPFKVSCIDRIFLTLIYLRHYPVDIFLAAIFNFPMKTIYNIKTKTVDFLYNNLKHFISLQTLEWRLENSITFGYGIYTFLIDGAEQPVTGSENILLDTKFYSVKKGKHTINTILVVSITKKKILYISPSFPGSINDNEITKKTKTNWFDFLNIMENGMGDSGFDGLSNEGIRISTPPNSKNYELYSLFSKYRVIVENRIADCKDWRICKDQLRLKITNSEEILIEHHKYWTIVAAFVNLNH